MLVKFRKVSCLSIFDRDHVLGLGGNLFKNLVLNRYLDAPELPEHESLDRYPCHISKRYLHDGEAVPVLDFYCMLSFPLAEVLHYYS